MDLSVPSLETIMQFAKSDIGQTAGVVIAALVGWRILQATVVAAGWR